MKYEREKQRIWGRVKSNNLEFEEETRWDVNWVFYNARRYFNEDVIENWNFSMGKSFKNKMKIN